MYNLYNRFYWSFRRLSLKFRDWCIIWGPWYREISREIKAEVLIDLQNFRKWFKKGVRPLRKYLSKAQTRRHLKRLARRWLVSLSPLVDIFITLIGFLNNLKSFLLHLWMTWLKSLPWSYFLVYFIKPLFRLRRFKTDNWDVIDGTRMALIPSWGVFYGLGWDVCLFISINYGVYVLPTTVFRRNWAIFFIFLIWLFMFSLWSFIFKFSSTTALIFTFIIFCSLTSHMRSFRESLWLFTVLWVGVCYIHSPDILFTELFSKLCEFGICQKSYPWSTGGIAWTTRLLNIYVEEHHYTQWYTFNYNKGSYIWVYLKQLWFLSDLKFYIYTSEWFNYLHWKLGHYPIWSSQSYTIPAERLADYELMLLEEALERASPAKEYTCWDYLVAVVSEEELLCFAEYLCFLTEGMLRAAISNKII